MATILRLTAMHHAVPQSNTDRVWVGLVRRMTGSGNVQFLSLYGRRGAALRTTRHEPTPHDDVAQNDYARACREKLAHGYLVVDWSDAYYGVMDTILGEGIVSTQVSDQSLPQVRAWWDEGQFSQQGVERLVPSEPSEPSINPTVRHTIEELSLRLPPGARAAWIADQIRQAAEFEVTLDALKADLHRDAGRPDLVPRVRKARRVNLLGEHA